MAYLKPQSPLKHTESGDYFYPLTTVDQVVMPDGSRLNSVFKHTVRANITLLASAWSSNTPYTQTITLNDYLDNLKVDANIVYSGIEETDLGLNKAASCLSYIKKNGKNIIFYCLSDKPEIDIPVEISYESLNGMATVGTSEKIDLDEELAEQAELIRELQEALQGKMGKGVLDFSIVGGANQPANPEENTIWIQTDDEENVIIEKWSFGVEEPVNPIEGMVQIVTNTSSNIKFDAIKDNDIQLYLISAKQYVNGAFVSKVAKIYQAGAWIQFSGNRYYLFKSGEGAVVPLKTYRETYAKISVTTDSITTSASSDGYCYASARTEATIDLSDYSKMCITYTAKKPEWNGNIIGVTGTKFTNGDAQPSNGVSYVATTEIGQTTNATTVTLDISTINDSLYCAFYYCGTMTITEWWLEE